MKPKKLFLVIVIMLAGIVLAMAGAFLKVRHISGAGIMLVTGFIVSIISALGLLPSGNEAQRIQPPDNFRKTLLHLSFSIGFGISIYALFLELAGLQKDTVVLTLSGISTLVFILMVLGEIYNSAHIKRSEKVVWAISIILFNYVAGLIYLLRGRRYVTYEFSGGTA